MNLENWDQIFDEAICVSTRASATKKCMNQSFLSNDMGKLRDKLGSFALERQQDLEKENLDFKTA